MSTPSAAKPGWADDVDHEVSHVILLYLMFRGQSVPNALLASAARTAFAAHFRALMEFFHDGRPSAADWGRQPCEPRSDVTLSDVVSGSPNPYARSWSKADLKRLCDADKLLGHVSTNRASRRRMRKEWGCKADWRQLRGKIRRFLRAASQNPDWYPNALAAGRQAGLVS